MTQKIEPRCLDEAVRSGPPKEDLVVPIWTTGLRSRLALGVGGFAAAYHIYTAALSPPPALEHRTVHLALGLVMCFLLWPASSKGHQRTLAAIVDIALIVGALIPAAFIVWNSNELLAMFSPGWMEITFALVLTGLVLEGTRRAAGWALPCLALIAIAYALWGDNLTGLFQHSGTDLGQLSRMLTLSTQGILGTALGVSATYVILFVLFGGLVQLSGAGNMIMQLADIVAGRFRGGSAKTATVASGLMGSISGSPVGNVATTGPVTIPMMRKSGFSARSAAAIEASASTGGMILPPVMGASAFLMAEILAIPYVEVVYAAAVPAILYYVALLFAIDSFAGRHRLSGSVTERALRALGTLLLMRGYQLLPLAVLIYMLIIESSTPARAAFWGLATAAVIAAVISGIRGIGWGYPIALIKTLADGFRSMVVIIMACATAGIVMGVMGLTGLGFRLSYILNELADGSVILLLVLTMIASIILGMSLPAVAAYLVLAVTVAPALVDLGVNPIGAHLFVLYFGVLSNITPPVGLAAFAAAGISGSEPQRTSVEAVKLAIPGYIIPYIIVYSPGLMLDGSVQDITLAIASALLAFWALGGCLAGYFGGDLGPVARLVIGLAGITLVVPELMIQVSGALIVTGVFIYKLIISKWRKNEN